MKEQKRSVLTKGKPSALSTKTGKLLGATDGAGPTGPTKPEEMSPEVLEFIQAMDDYRARCGRPFPSWSEVLDVLMRLGYRKVARSM